VSSWPSTPDPYPPSLHDALPILATLGPRSLRLQQLDRTEGSSRVLHELRETLALKKLDEKGTSGSEDLGGEQQRLLGKAHAAGLIDRDRKSTRLNSSHVKISYAVFCLKKKRKQE